MEPGTVFNLELRELDDATLALLSVNLIVLQRRGHKLLLRGMRDHQIRLLDHFGIAVGLDGAVDVVGERELPFTD
jgi:hypothetical protein